MLIATMKYISLLLIGILTVVATPVLSDKEAPIENQQTEAVVSSIEPDSERVNAEPTKEPVETKKAPKWSELSREEKIKLNPQDCDLNKQIMYESDGSCHDKPTVQSNVPSQSVTVHSNVSSSGGCERWRPLVSKYDWNINIAMAVMQAESTQHGIACNPNAANTTDMHRDYNGNLICVGSYGLFQISCHSGQVYDPAQNVAIAYQKYQARGWSPWGAYTNGSYLQYLR